MIFNAYSSLFVVIFIPVFFYFELLKNIKKTKIVCFLS
jgi:hypothetical protein